MDSHSDNPLEQPAPVDLLQRVHAFARDLAYGAAKGLWHTRIQWQALTNPDISNVAGVFAKYLREKWGTDFPSEYLLVSLDYFDPVGDETGRSTYLLTEKAFRLLEKPSSPPSVFISYRRSESTALALLIEARMKMAGNPNPYIDKNLIPGQDWNDQLEERIRQSRYFVVLVGKTTLESPNVLQELNWAEQAGCTIISIWHGYKMEADAPVILQERHAITIDTDSALGYETAINQLLNGLGYATY